MLKQLIIAAIPYVLPRFLSSQSSDFEMKAEEVHRKLVGIQPCQAENRYENFVDFCLMI